MYSLYAHGSCFGALSVPDAGIQREGAEASFGALGDQYRTALPEGPGPDVVSPYETLGVDRSVAGEELRAAYLSRIAQYHPDKVAALGAELRELAERKSKEINEAYRALAGR